jgi:hypothetical protein
MKITRMLLISSQFLPPGGSVFLGYVLQLLFDEKTETFLNFTIMSFFPTNIFIFYLSLNAAVVMEDFQCIPIQL